MSVEKATIDPIIAKFNIIQDDKKGAKKHGILSMSQLFILKIIK